MGGRPAWYHIYLYMIVTCFGLRYRGHFRVIVKSVTALLLNHSLGKVAYMWVHITENEVIEDIFGMTPSRERMYYEFVVHIHKKVKLAVSISRWRDSGERDSHSGLRGGMIDQFGKLRCAGVVRYKTDADDDGICHVRSLNCGFSH